MVSVDAVVSTFIAQAPLIAVAVVVLYYTLNSRIEKVAESLKMLEAEIKTQMQHVEREVGQLRQRITSLEQEITSLKGEVTSLKQITTSLEHEVKSLMPLKQTVTALEQEVRSLKLSLRQGLRSLASGFYNYQETLVDFLAAKGVITVPEAALLRGSLKSLVPVSKSKYYTEEVRRRLIELLEKDVEEYTWEDVAELEKIANAIYKEYEETGREDLIEYYPKLRMFTAIIRGLLRRKEMEKK